MNTGYGPGPNSTPLVAGELVFAVGSTGKLHALDKKTGRVVWKKDLWGEMGGQVHQRGYAPSPLAYGENVILPVGGAGQALVAFRQKDGQVAWKSHTFDISPASPVLITVDGQEQLVLFHGEGVAGVDPNGGPVFWNHPHRTQYNLNISMPVWGDGNLLFVSSAYDGGSRALRLRRSGEKTAVEELWFSSKMRDPLRRRGPSGRRRVRLQRRLRPRLLRRDRGGHGQGPVAGPLARPGHVRGRRRQARPPRRAGRARARHPGTDGLKVLGKAQVLNGRCWTVPSLVGTRLFLRDRTTIKALDLA